MRTAVAVALALALLALVAPVGAQTPKNLVVNYSFEQGFDSFEGGEVGKGWTPFRLSGSLSYRDTSRLAGDGIAERAEGQTSQTLWSDGTAFSAGIWQRRSVTSGRYYRASFATAAKIRSGGTITRTVGLDPTGGTDPKASTVIWGNGYAAEPWVAVDSPSAPNVRAAAASDRMTIFVKVVSNGFGQLQSYIDTVYLVEDGPADVAPTPFAGPQTITATSQAPASLGARPAGTQGKDDYPVDGGWFYSQANGKNAGGELGYVVSDNDGVPFWSAFQRFGGTSAVGYPVSQRFLWDGFVCQAFQKVIFQFRPDQGGSVMFVNVFDQFAKAGKDSWLRQARTVPNNADWSVDTGKDFETITQNHFRLLDKNPGIKAVYFISPDPLRLNGLPMGYEEYSTVAVLRTQRMVFQQWKIDVPWAKAGQVVLANGGDLVKESGLLPQEATSPQLAGFRPANLPVVQIAVVSPSPTPTSSAAPLR